MSAPPPYRTILVTGCPRSGTTPVGANLALAPRARYLYEPFNPRYGLRAISRYYEVPGANGFSPETFDGCVEAIRRLRMDLRRYDWPGERGVRRLVKRVVGSRSHVSYWLCRLDWTLETVIWKDPIACFSSDAVVDRHRIPVVVTVRPAAAVAASYRRMQWQSGVAAVFASLAQVGIDFTDLRRRYEHRADNPVIGAALLWCAVYTTLLRWAETRPQIRFVSLQDSIDRPLEVYRDLYAWLGLGWTGRVEHRLGRRYGRREAGDAIGSPDLPQRAHVSRRRLDEVNTYGRALLTEEEIELIEGMTSGLWSRLSAACVARKTGTPGGGP
jgi:hypothetical protein